jgi:hypothetical protein
VIYPTLVLISSSAAACDVNTKFRTIVAPVMVNQPAIFADMGLVDGAVSGTSGCTTSLQGPASLDVRAAAGDLAAGFSGTVRVFTGTESMNYGVPSAQALLVATLPGQTTKWAIFAYETGTQIYGLVAPARRIGFFLSETSPTSLTADAWLLFDAAVVWLAKSG